MTRKRLLSGIAIAAAAVPLLGLLVAASGVIPIDASSGHWAVTQWFLQLSKRRSVSLHAPASLAPEASWMALKGAGHYHVACLPCHGPERSVFRGVAGAMSAPPPDLRTRVRELEDEELFHVVRHGLKFTGMPAWPAPERDDEVRAMVAFLRRLPALGPAEYRAMVHGDTARELAAAPSAPASLGLCARCHGVDGLGRGDAAFPRLAGQTPEYLTNALRAYARGDRRSGIMQPVAAALTAEQERELVAWYATRDPGGPDPTVAADAASIERGRRLAQAGDPARRVPSCVDCHGPGAGRSPAYPELAGQYAEYLRLQLELFRAGKRGGSPHAHLMDAVAPGLTAEQLADVTRYYGSLDRQGTQADGEE